MVHLLLFFRFFLWIDEFEIVKGETQCFIDQLITRPPTFARDLFDVAVQLGLQTNGEGHGPFYLGRDDKPFRFVFHGVHLSYLLYPSRVRKKRIQYA